MASFFFQTHGVLILSKTTLATNNSILSIHCVPTNHALGKPCKTGMTKPGARLQRAPYLVRRTDVGVGRIHTRGEQG